MIPCDVKYYCTWRNATNSEKFEFEILDFKSEIEAENLDLKSIAMKIKNETIDKDVIKEEIEEELSEIKEELSEIEEMKRELKEEIKNEKSFETKNKLQEIKMEAEVQCFKMMKKSQFFLCLLIHPHSPVTSIFHHFQLSSSYFPKLSKHPHSPVTSIFIFVNSDFCSFSVFVLLLNC